MDLGTAVGAIQIVYDGAGAQQAKADLGQLQGAAGPTNAAMLAAGAGVAGLVAGAAKFTQEAIGIAADVEAGLLSIEAATGATDQELQALDQTIGQLGKDTVFSAQEIVGAADTMAKAGISVEDQVGGALKTVSDLAAATDESLNTSAGTVADAMAIFRLGGEDVAQVADLTTQAVNASKIGLDEYNAGFRNLAPTMANFANSQEEAIDLLGQTGEVVAFFTANGLKGADAGLSFARMIENLATPATEDYANAIEAAGLSMFDAQGNFIGTEAAIEKVNKAFAGLTDQEKVDLLDQLGIGAEARDVVGIIGAVGDEYGEFVDGMRDGNTAAEAAAIRMQGFSGAIESLQGSLSEAMRQMGGTLLAPLEGIVRAITAAINIFLELPAPVKAAAGAFIAFLAPVAAVAGAVAALTGPLAGVVGAFLAMIGPIALVAAALAALFVAYQNNLFGIRDTVESALSKAGKAVETFGKRFQSSFGARQAQGVNALSAAVGALGDALKVATGIDITGFTDGLASGIQAMVDSFNSAIEGGMNPFAAALNALSTGAALAGFPELSAALVQASDAAQRFGDTFGAVFTAAQASGVNGLSAGIQALGGALSEILGVDVTGFFNGIASAVTNLGNLAGQVATTIRDALTAAFTGLTDNVLPGVVSALGNVLGTLRDVGAELLSGDFSQAGQIIGDALGSLGEWAGNVVQGLGEALRSVDVGAIAGGVADAIRNALSTVGDLLSGVDLGNIASSIGTAIMAALEAVGGFLGTAAQVVGDALGTALSNIGNFITQTDFASILQSVSDAIISAFNAGGEWLSGAAQAVGSALGAALQNVGNFLGAIDFGDLVSKVIDAITSAFGGSGGGELSGSGHIAGGGGLGSIAEVIGGAITDALSRVGDFVKSIDLGSAVETVRTTIENAFNGLQFNLSTMGQQLASAVEAACGVDLTAAFDAIGQAVTEALSAVSRFVGLIGGYISSIQSAFEQLEVPEALTEFGELISGIAADLAGDIVQKIGEFADAIAGLNIPEAASAAITAIGDALTSIASSLNQNLPDLLSDLGEALSSLSIPDGLASAITTLGDAFGAVATKIGEALGALKDWASETSGATGETPEALGFLDVPTGDPAILWANDQAQQATDQAGDFATNFISLVAQSFVGADWSAVTNAIQTGLNTALGGGAPAGLGGTVGQGEGQGAAIGQSIASNLVNQIAASFTPEIFAPIKAAFDTALASAFAGASEGQPAEGGQSTGIAQSLVAGIASSLGTQVEPLKAALQAVISAAGAAIQPTSLQGVGQVIISGIASSLGGQTGVLQSALNAVISAVIASANAAAAAANTVGTALTTAIGNGVGQGTGTVQAAVQAMVSAVIAAGQAAAAAANAIGNALATAAGAGIGQGTGTLISAVQAMVQSAIQAGVGAAAGASAIGEAISSGAAGGVNVHALDAVVAEMVSNGIAAGKAAMESSSPSIVAKEELGEPIPEGAALGVEEGTPEFAGSVESMVQTAMSAGEAALQSARDLFAQYGMEFGNEITGQMGASLEAGMPQVAERLRGAADQLRQSVMDRVQRMHEAWLPSADSVIAERNPWAANLMRDQEMVFQFDAVLDGEKMSEWTVRETLGGMLNIPDRGGRKRGLRAGK